MDRAPLRAQLALACALGKESRERVRSTCSVRAGIERLGRIGCNVFRAEQESPADVEIVAVNDITDITDIETLAQPVLVRAHA